MIAPVQYGRTHIAAFEPPDVDLAAAHRSIWCLPHKFMVAVPDKPDQRSGFFIPAKTSQRERLPIGIVIAAGDQTDLHVGDHVLVESKYAKAVGGLRVGDFRCWGDVWMFGLTSQHVRICSIVGVRHSAIAVVGSTPFEAPAVTFESQHGETEERRSFGWRVHDSKIKRWSRAAQAFKGDGRVLIQLQEKSNQQGGIYVPDRHAERPDIGWVVGASSQCEHVRVGDKVIYMRRGLEAIYPDGKKNLGFAPERAIYAVVRA